MVHRALENKNRKEAVVEVDGFLSSWKKYQEILAMMRRGLPAKE
jgi:hypothetical protein